MSHRACRALSAETYSQREPQQRHTRTWDPMRRTISYNSQRCRGICPWLLGFVVGNRYRGFQGILLSSGRALRKSAACTTDRSKLWLPFAGLALGSGSGADASKPPERLDGMESVNPDVLLEAPPARRDAGRHGPCIQSGAATWKDRFDAYRSTEAR
jgi:hypothetical protein